MQYGPLSDVSILSVPRKSVSRQQLQVCPLIRRVSVIFQFTVLECVPVRKRIERMHGVAHLSHHQRDVSEWHYFQSVGYQPKPITYVYVALPPNEKARASCQLS